MAVILAHTHTQNNSNHLQLMMTTVNQNLNHVVFAACCRHRVNDNLPRCLAWDSWLSRCYTCLSERYVGGSDLRYRKKYQVTHFLTIFNLLSDAKCDPFEDPLLRSVAECYKIRMSRETSIIRNEKFQQ